MNAPIRRVGYAVCALMIAIVGQLTYLQVVKAQELCEDKRNVRRVINDFARPRGEIVTADDQVVALSKPVNDEFKYQREYPQAELFAHIVGYQSFVFGNAGVEASYNDALAGRSRTQCVRNLEELTSALSPNENDPGQVRLTVSAAAQRIAKEALGDETGSVVVLEPATGAIVASYTNPTYDPRPLTDHDSIAVQEYQEKLAADPAKPFLPRAYAEIYPPGSTYKVVTASSALEEGVAELNTVFPTQRVLDLPLTDKTIQNFGGSNCGGTFTESFVRSCNTVFAQLGLDLGNRFVQDAQNFGVGLAPPLDLANPGSAASTNLEEASFRTQSPFFALAGIGQGPISVTPLEMALAVSGIANDGVIMEPHVGAEVLNAAGNTVRTIEPKAWRTATDPQTAQEVTDLMVQVVQRGTGTAARIPGLSVAGKTGTAQTDSGAPHAWFVAFAPAEQPQYAIAVIVENGGSIGDEATGGRVAAPIARKVLSALLGKG